MKPTLRNGLILISIGIVLTPIAWFSLVDEGLAVLSAFFWILVFFIIPGIVFSIIGLIKK